MRIFLNCWEPLKLIQPQQEVEIISSIVTVDESQKKCMRWPMTKV
jgi:hypothetical protein